MVIRKSKRPIFRCLFGLDDAVLGGIIGVAGDLFGASMASDAQSSATQANREMQERNIEWEREQLQNKHQWEVADLRAAGLNPILSTHAASSAVSAGTPSNTPVKPEFALSRTLEAISNSALMQKQEQIASYDAETRRIQALAQKKLANVEESKSPSAIALNESSRWLNLQNAERISHLWPMEVAYAKANVDYTVQKMINSIIEVNAKAQYYEKAGDAQLMMGSAAQSQAAAAHRQADISAQIAATMEKNGVSEREVNRWKAGDYEQQIRESVARTGKILTEDKQLNFNLQKDMLHNPNYRRTDGGNWFTDAVFGTGEYLREINPLRGMFGN